MIKISFFYGVMKSSKTANLLMTCHNYEAKGINPLLVKPSLDTRSKYIESRIGLKKVADCVITKGANRFDFSDIISVLKPCF